MQSRSKLDQVERVFRFLHHPYYLLGAAAMFFAVALSFSWTLGADGGGGEEYKQQWGGMVSYFLYGLIAFGVGIRGLCLRKVESCSRFEDAPEDPKTSLHDMAGGERGPTTARMSYVKFFSLFALGSWAVAGINWRAGHHNLALGILGLTPLYLLCFGISFLASTKKKREIVRNMSSADRARVEEMGRDYGKLVGMYFAVPLSIITTLTYFLTDQDASIAGAVFVVGLLVGIPVLYRLAAPMREFASAAASSELIE